MMKGSWDELAEHDDGFGIVRKRRGGFGVR
jgi:hypothetical protein